MSKKLRDGAMPQARTLAADKLILAVATGCFLGYVGYLATRFSAGGWIVDAAGHPEPTDFVALWTAGKLAAQGAAHAAYDPHLRHAAQATVVGHDFQGYFDWAYPPVFLFVVALLATLPYAVAFIVWVTLTVAGYALSVGAITQTRAAVLVALAAPWTFAVMQVGQTGLLTATLIATVLLSLERRAVLSGLVLGLLIYKPQFGLLFPFALAADGYWGAFIWAGVSVALLLALSGVVFGFDTLVAFWTQLPLSSHALITQGGVGWNKLQSFYGLARWLGAGDVGGWAAQAIATASATLAVVALWRSKRDFDLKAAGLCAGALLATPYVFAHDMPVLAIAFAFLFRHRMFDAIEYLGLGAAVLAFLAFAFLAVPACSLASIALLVLIARRLTSP